MDPMTLGVGGGLLAVGWLVGHIRRRPRPEPQSTPTCGCGDALALHDPTTGECHGEVRREHYLKGGDRSGWEWLPCTCRQYTGPRPIEELFGPTYLSPSGSERDGTS